MITAADIKGKVDTEQRKQNETHTRMDDDFDIWNLDKTEFDSHTNAINVCLPDPRNFADDVQSTLVRANMQIIVRMADQKEDEGTSKLERLLTFAFEKGDELLGRKLLPPLRDAVVWYGLIRGCRAGRFFVHKIGSDVIFDLLPWDPRWVTYQVGANGLIWAAYKMFMTKEAIQDEWQVTPQRSLLDSVRNIIPFTSNKEVFEAIDYWSLPDPKEPTEILNAVICGDQWLKKPDVMTLPSMPISIRPVAVSPPIIKDQKVVGGFGECIYAPNRDIYELLNELCSIEATRGKLLSKQPVINYYTDDGMVNLKDTVLQAEAIIDVPMGKNRLEPMPMLEIPQTLLDMIDKLTRKKERGEVPDIEIGKPPASGIALSLVQEAGDKVFVPQLRNLSLFYADICRLIEEQVIAQKLKIDVETIEKRKYYKTQVTPVDLKKPHVIKVEFSSRSAWLDLATAELADMLKRQGIPDQFIWEHIYKFPDPKGLSDQAIIEIAEHSPNVIRLRAIDLLEERGREREALGLVMEMFDESGEGETPPEIERPEVTTA